MCRSLILAVAMVLVAFKVVPIAVGFFGAAVLMVATWQRCRCARPTARSTAQVLILIGALTPLSEAVQATGGTDLIAGESGRGCCTARRPCSHWRR